MASKLLFESHRDTETQRLQASGSRLQALGFGRRAMGHRR